MPHFRGFGLPASSFQSDNFYTFLSQLARYDAAAWPCANHYYNAVVFFIE